MQTLVQQFISARNVGTPLVAINTPDPAATIALIGKSAKVIYTNPINISVPMIQWDVNNGWNAINEAGVNALELLFEDPVTLRQSSVGPLAHLMRAQELPEATILFMMNAHRYLDSPQCVQAIWNLRDPFKHNFRTLVMLSPHMALPAELQQDVLVLDEPLPNDSQLTTTVKRTLELAGVSAKSKSTLVTEAVNALRGLALFPAEQSVAMSVILGEGLDVQALWERKRQLINETAGLSVWRGQERFDDLGGLSQVKDYFKRMLAGRDPFRVVVFLDEGEKMFAGSTGQVGDSSGISQGFLGTMLSYQQDTEADGVMFVGPTGAAKSAFAKALANEAGVPCIALDLNGMKAPLVGESEARLRNALKIIAAVGGGRALFIMTCNRHSDLPPELRRRYPDTFFFDLPDDKERKVILDIYVKKYNIDASATERNAIVELPLTGDEIRRCCLKAYRMSMTLTEASKYIVPVARAAREEIRLLREQANGKFLSASYAGTYVNIDPTKKSGGVKTERSRSFAGRKTDDELIN